MEWISKLLDIKKVPTKIVFLFWFVSLLLLYLPSQTLQQLGLVEFKQEYGKYFGIVFLVTTSFLLIIIFTWLYKKIDDKIFINKYKKIIKDAINNLDIHEKAVLREFYIQGVNTLKVPIDNPTVSGLIDKRVLYQVGDYGQISLVGMLFSYAITETAKKHITNELLDLPRSKPTEEELNRIRDTRPEWIKQLQARWY